MKKIYNDRNYPEMYPLPDDYPEDYDDLSVVSAREMTGLIPFAPDRYDDIPREDDCLDGDGYC